MNSEDSYCSWQLAQGYSYMEVGRWDEPLSFSIEQHLLQHREASASVQ